MADSRWMNVFIFAWLFIMNGPPITKAERESKISNDTIHDHSKNGFPDFPLQIYPRKERNDQIQRQEVDDIMAQSAENMKKRILRLAVFADMSLVNHLSEMSPENPLLGAYNYIITGTSAIESLLQEAMDSDLSLEILLVHIGVWSELAEQPIRKDANAGGTLLNFCNWASRANSARGSPGYWHHAMLLTRKEVFSTTAETIGTTFLGGACFPVKSCSLVEAHSFKSVHIAAHEIAHSLGIPHDGREGASSCPSVGYIMGEAITEESLTWSDCSKRAFKQILVEHQCLETNDQESSTIFTTRMADGMHTEPARFPELDHNLGGLPGQRYPADAQCQLAFGQDYKAIPSRTNVCHYLTCSNGVVTKGAHPALPGTSCGENLVCSGGSCSGRIPPPSPPVPEKPPTTFPGPPTGLPSPPTNIPLPPPNVPSPPTNIPWPPTNVPSPPTNIPWPPTNVPSPPGTVPSPPTNIPWPPTNVPSPPTNIPWPPPGTVPSPPTNIPWPPTNVPSPPTNIPWPPPGTVPSPPTNIPWPPTNIPSPPGTVPSPPTNFPWPPTNIPSPPGTVPLPPTNFPWPPTNIPSPPGTVPSPPTNIPWPPTNIPSPPGTVPLPPTNFPWPPTNIPSPPGTVPSPPTNIPWPPTNIPSPPGAVPSPPTNFPWPPTNIPSPPGTVPSPPTNIPWPPTNIPSPPGTVPFPPNNLPWPFPPTILPSPPGNIIPTLFPPNLIPGLFNIISWPSHFTSPPLAPSNTPWQTGNAPGYPGIVTQPPASFAWPYTQSSPSSNYSPYPGMNIPSATPGANLGPFSNILSSFLLNFMMRIPLGLRCLFLPLFLHPFFGCPGTNNGYNKLMVQAIYEAQALNSGYLFSTPTADLQSFSSNVTEKEPDSTAGIPSSIPQENVIQPNNSESSDLWIFTNNEDQKNNLHDTAVGQLEDSNHLHQIINERSNDWYDHEYFQSSSSDKTLNYLKDLKSTFASKDIQTPVSMGNNKLQSQSNLTNISSPLAQDKERQQSSRYQIQLAETDALNPALKNEKNMNSGDRFSDKNKTSLITRELMNIPTQVFDEEKIIQTPFTENGYTDNSSDNSDHVKASDETQDDNLKLNDLQRLLHNLDLGNTVANQTKPPQNQTQQKLIANRIIELLGANLETNLVNKKTTNITQVHRDNRSQIMVESSRRRKLNPSFPSLNLANLASLNKSLVKENWDNGTVINSSDQFKHPKSYPLQLLKSPVISEVREVKNNGSMTETTKWKENKAAAMLNKTDDGKIVFLRSSQLQDPIMAITAPSYIRVKRTTPCSRSCGIGTRITSQVCISGSEPGEEVPTSLCDGLPNSIPPYTELCNTFPCHAPEWIVKPWGHCSEWCDTGVQHRQVDCAVPLLESGSAFAAAFYLRHENCHKPKPVTVRLCQGPCLPVNCQVAENRFHPGCLHMLHDLSLERDHHIMTTTKILLQEQSLV
ncbi:uncharacterized protein [Palaemon carinicauda]|uniref:uncharacterized protein n=1 Tax=Palaemon carinicauda TaxID=392227 RepID=UPI0035B6A02C